MKWQYLILTVSNEECNKARLDSLGQSGWELVAVAPGTIAWSKYIFKRPMTWSTDQFDPYGNSANPGYHATTLWEQPK